MAAHAQRPGAHMAAYAGVDSDLREWRSTWTPAARSLVESWAERQTPESREQKLEQLLEAVLALGHTACYAPAAFDRVAQELAFCRIALTARDTPDGNMMLQYFDSSVCCVGHGDGGGDELIFSHQRSSSEPRSAGGSASPLSLNANGFQLDTLLTLLDAIDGTAHDATAEERVRLVVYDGFVEYDADGLLAFLQREEPGAEHLEREDAVALLAARRFVLRATGAALLIAAAKESPADDAMKVARERLAAEALYTRMLDGAHRRRFTARELLQVARSASPPWLLDADAAIDAQRSAQSRAAGSMHSLMDAGALRMAAALIDDATVPRHHSAFFPGDDARAEAVFQLAFLANPHMLQFMSGRRGAPAAFGLPVSETSSERFAAAWFAAQAQAHAARASCDEEADALVKPGCWASEAARRLARTFLDAPFSGDDAFHAAVAQHSERVRAAGAAAFARRDHARAAECFSYAMAVLPWRGAPGGDDRVAALLSSRSQCALAAGNAVAAEADASASLAVRPGHVKTLLRRAAARSALGFSTADEDLRAARRIQAEDAAAARYEGAPA